MQVQVSVVQKETHGRTVSLTYSNNQLPPNYHPITPTHRLVDGSCDVPHYGLRAAEAFGGFPPEMMRDAWTIARRVEASSRVVPGVDVNAGERGGGLTTVASEATRVEVETAVRTAKIAERARRLCEAGGDSSNDGEREKTLASLCAMAVEIVGGGAGGGACA